MEKNHQCNPQAHSYYCYQCLAPICSKCVKALHKDHPLSVIADYKEILQSHCSELALAKNLQALHQFKEKVDFIIESYISKCESSLRQIESAIKVSLTQENVKMALASKFVASCPVQSNLKETLSKITSGIKQTASNLCENINALVPKKKLLVGVLADYDTLCSLKNEYSVWYYSYYRSLVGPLASVVKNLVNNEGIVVWNTKGKILI